MINRYLNILLIFATFFISSDTEITLFENSGISIEIILLAFSFFLNLLSIKKALWKRFKPEQIARFGNIHVIYPSLSKLSYYGIIKKKIKNCF